MLYKNMKENSNDKVLFSLFEQFFFNNRNKYSKIYLNNKKNTYKYIKKTK